MKPILLLCLSLALVGLVGPVGCTSPKTTTQGAAFKSIASVAMSVDSSMRTYWEIVTVEQRTPEAARIIKFKDRIKIEGWHDRYQPILQKTIIVYEGATTNAAPAELIRIGSDLAAEIAVMAVRATR